MKKSQQEIPEIQADVKAQFTPGELTAILSIIDMSTRRGVFTARDLPGVAQVYQKIITYLPEGPNNG